MDTDLPQMNRLALDSASIVDLLTRAQALHEQEKLDDAKQIYDAILVDFPHHAEALHLSGVVQFQRGQTTEAEYLIRRSVSIDASPLPLANLGSVLVTLGRRGEALRYFDEALAIDPRHVYALVRRANALLEMGHYEDALATYDRALVVVPTLLDALCNRGSALRALGRFQEALDTYEHALLVDPRSVEALANRGNVFRNMGRHEDALKSYVSASDIAPGNVQLMSLRGRELMDLGRFQEALAVLNGAIASKPDFIEALHNSAVVLERLDLPEQAIARCDRVLALEPMNVQALGTRGNAWLRLERHEAALKDYDRALEIDPTAHDVLCNRGSVLRQAGRREEALASYDAALALDANVPEAWVNRGNVLQDLHRYLDALDADDRALQIDEGYALAWFNRGNVLQLLKRPDEALVSYDRAISINPDYVDAQLAQAFVFLRRGEFPRGWEQYEWRLRSMTEHNTRNFSQPRWTGVEPLVGKTLLLYAEQGFGDTLQFCRYARHISDRGAKVILDVQPALTSLIASLDSRFEVVGSGESLPSFDMQCPLLSLPHALGADSAAIPGPSPYLHSSPSRVEKWVRLLGDKRRTRIGLAWSGNPVHSDDSNRSIPLDVLRPLLGADAEWISLQKVVRGSDEAALASLPLRDFRSQIGDFSDTAALMQTLDLVISVDTSVAHLAGSINRPLWILLPHFSDWRWAEEGETSMWYPSARLFRQAAAGDWSEAIDRVGRALRAL